MSGTGVESLSGPISVGDGEALVSVLETGGMPDGGVKSCDGLAMIPKVIISVMVTAQAAPLPTRISLDLLSKPLLRLRLLPVLFKYILNFSTLRYKVRQVCQMTCPPYTMISGYDHTNIQALKGRMIRLTQNLRGNCL